MNNNPYYYERMVESKMREVDRELEQARLLREAGLSGSNLLARVAKSLRNLFAARRKSLQDQSSIEHPSYQS